MQRKILTWTAYALGVAMILTGLASIVIGSPRPELATGGVTLLMATGLIGAANGNGRRR